MSLECSICPEWRGPVVSLLPAEWPQGLLRLAQHPTFPVWNSKCLVKYPVKQFSCSPSPSLSQFLHKAGHLMLWWGCGKNSLCDSKSDISETCLIFVAVNPDSCPISELPLQASNPFLILPFLGTSPFLTFVLLLTPTVSLILSLRLSLSIQESGRRVAFSQRLKPFASHFSG